MNPLRCPQCGGPLLAGVPGTGCLHCLLRLGLSDDPEPDKNANSEAPEQAGTGRDPNATSNRPEAGRQFGDYELVEEIGRGAMGVVYRARQVRLDRWVAVKLLLVGPFASPESAKRFEREAQASGSLRHPNIVPTHDYGVIRGQPFISMDWIPGPNLSELIRNRPMAPARSARLAMALARAIGYAHARGILHRDLKPSNVVVDAEDQPHLTDFGLAKRLGEALDLTLTGQLLGSPNYMAPEQAAGRQDQIGPAIDIYALGAILYHCLTGRPPFVAESVPATLRQVQESEPVAPRLLNASVPPDLETVCLKCLEKAPGRRFESAEELAAELERFLEGRPIRSLPVGPAARVARWCRRHPGLATLAGALGLLLLAVGLLGALAIGQASRARDAEGAERQQRRMAESLVQDQRDRLVQAAIESGRRLFEAADPTAALLWYVEAFTLAAGEPLDQETHRIRIASTLRHCSWPEALLPHPNPVTLVAFTRDGRRALTLAGHDGSRDGAGINPQGWLTLWNLATSQPVFPPLPHTSLQWGSAGFKTIGIRYRPLDARDRHLFTILTQGDSISNVTSRVQVHDTRSGRLVGPPIHTEGYVPFAEFSPDGSWIALATARFLPGRVSAGDAQVWNVTTGQRVGPVLFHDGPVKVARFHPDGRRVLTACQDGTARLWELPSGRQVVPPMVQGGNLLYAGFDPTARRLVTTGITPFLVRVWDSRTGQPLTDPLPHRSVDGHVFAAYFSGDDRWLVSFGYDQTVRVWDVAAGRPAFPPLHVSRGVSDARFHPDNRTLAAAVWDGEVRRWKVEDGSPTGGLIVQKENLYSFDIAPDGQRLLAGGSSGVAMVWRLDVPGSESRVLPHGGAILDHRLGPEGRHLVTACTDYTVRVWDVESARTLSPPLVHPHRVMQAVSSPDGQRVATACLDWTARLWDTHTGRELTPPLRHGNTVWSVDFDASGRRLVTAAGPASWVSGHYDPNRKIHEGPPGGEARVWDVDTGEPLTPTIRAEAAILQASFSPDGQRILTAGSDRTARLWDAATGAPLEPIIRTPGILGRAEFSPDGTRILTTAIFTDHGENPVGLYDARTGLPTTPALGTPGGNTSSRFSPDGHRIVICGFSRSSISLYDVRTGQRTVPDLQAPTQILDAAFSRDGRWLVSGARDGVVRLWDSHRGTLMAQFFGHTEYVDRVSFCPDGRHVISTGLDGQARVWTLPSESRPLHDLVRLARVLSGRRIDASGQIAPAPPHEIVRDWGLLREKYPGGFHVDRTATTRIPRD